jgi:predicted esterase
MSDKYAMQSWPLRRYEFPMPIRYHLTPKTGPGVVFCLHGYQDHALSMIRRLGWWIRPDLPFQLCAINGPFPVPVWQEDGFKEAYSWYFRDTSRELDFVSPDTTAARLKFLVNDLGLENTPKVLVGFSMGGFLAPYLAAELKHVKGIIGIGCGYNADAYAKIPALTVHAIHGENDERIGIEGSKADFAKVIQAGHNGQYHAIPGLTHKVEASLEPLVRRLALEELTK